MFSPETAVILASILTVTSAIKCYSGTSVSTTQMAMVPEDCGQDFDQCLLFTMEVNSFDDSGTPTKIDVNVGQCSSTLVCQLVTCDAVEASMKAMMPGVLSILPSCEKKCCGTDFCNPGSGKVSQITPNLSDNLECYDGTWIDPGYHLSPSEITVPGKSKKTCVNPGDKCLISKSTTSYLGISVTTNTASCISGASCPYISCDSIRAAQQSIVPTMIMTQCDVTCCDTPLCNLPEKQFYTIVDHIIPLTVDDEETSPVLTGEDNCLILPKHDACCGKLSYKSKKFGCCDNGDRQSRYKLSKKGCCAGEIYKLNLQECVDGVITNIKK